MDKSVNVFEQLIKSGGVVFVGVGILFVLIAIVVGVFKQTWLISGVNTMPKEKLAKMDLEYVAKYFGLFFGIFGGIVTLSPFIFIYLNIMKYFFGFFMISTLGFCTFMILYFNVIKRKRIYNKDASGQTQSVEVPTKIRRKFIHIAIVVAFIGLMLLSGEREYKIVIDTNTFKLKGVYGVNLPFAEIAEADTIARSEMPAISIRTNGYGGFKMRKGGLLGNDKFIHWEKYSYFFAVILVTMLAICKLTYNRMSAEIKWNKIARQSLYGNTIQMLPIYRSIYDRLKNNELFLYN